jgi:hypothetical protein
MLPFIKDFFPLESQALKSFWQAFPAGSGPMDRTTYMFTYVSPQPGSPKLEELLEDFWDLMPEYQVNFQIAICRITFTFNFCSSASWWYWILFILRMLLLFNLQYVPCHLLYAKSVFFLFLLCSIHLWKLFPYLGGFPNS